MERLLNFTNCDLFICRRYRGCLLTPHAISEMRRELLRTITHKLDNFWSSDRDASFLSDLHQWQIEYVHLDRFLHTPISPDVSGPHADVFGPHANVSGPHADVSGPHAPPDVPSGSHANGSESTPFRFREAEEYWDDSPSSLDGESCSICQEQLTRRRPTKALPCRHKFHKRCITIWVSIRRCCPNCNYRI